MTTGEGPVLEETRAGLTIRYLGRNLYSPTSPASSAVRRAEALTLLPGSLVFVPSPLLFYGVDRILAAAPSGTHLMCVEADQDLMKLSLEHSPGALLQDERLTYLRTSSVEEVLRRLHTLGIHRFRRAVEAVLNGGHNLNRELYQEIFRAVEYEIQSHWRNRVTLMHMSHLWIKNLFRNLPSVSRGRDVAELQIDRPVVVAGAGESLEGAMPLLLQLRDRYFLMAVDTAVQSLQGFGLKPDAVTVLDAQSANLADLIGFHTSHSMLIADVFAYPECIRRFAGERWYFCSRFAQLALFDRARSAGVLPMTVPPLGSVGIAALYLALKITAAPVFFAGLDFSFLPGKTHARGAPVHLAGLLGSERLKPVDAFVQSAKRPHHVVSGKSGRAVWTDTTLEGYSTALGFLLGDNERIYDLGRNGLPTRAPLVTETATFERLLGQASKSVTRTTARRAAGRRRAGRANDGRRHDRVRAFLREERRRIDQGVELALETLQKTGPTTGGDVSERNLRSLLRDLDYIYVHFADWSENPELTESFLKRFVEAAETRRQWLDRAIGAADSAER